MEVAPSHNDLQSKQVPIPEVHPYITFAQTNSHLHPLPQTKKKTGQETVKREKKGEKTKFDVQDTHVLLKIQSREAHHLTRIYIPNL